MHLRKTLLQAGAQIEKILEGQIGMQAADDVKLGDGLGVSRGGSFKSLIERHSVGAGRVSLAAEGAQAAGRYANVGGVDVAIDVEIRLIAMHALTDVIGHPAHSENVAGAVEGKGVRRVEPLTCDHSGVDGLKARVVGPKWMIFARRRHRLHDIAGKHQKSPEGGDR